MHEVGMATSGHDILAHSPVPVVTCTEAAPNPASVHHGAHHLVSDPEPGSEPADAPAPCREVRAVSPLSRAITLDIDPGTSAALPEGSGADRDRHVSRDLVLTPPAHPPDIERSLYQVYRI